MKDPQVQASLKESINEAEWSWLAPHLLRGAVIVVSQQLTLLEAGSEVANNNVTKIQEWIQMGLLAKPSAEQIKAWDQ